MLFAGPYIPFDIMQLILVALLVNGMICFFVLDRFFVCVERPRKKKDKKTDGKSVSMQNLGNKSSIVEGSPAPSPVPSPAPTSDAALVDPASLKTA